MPSENGQVESRAEGINHTQERFNAYVATIRRLRWFLLIATIIAGVAFLHLFLERFGYQESQLKSYLLIQDQRASELEDLENRILVLERKIAPCGNCRRAACNMLARALWALRREHATLTFFTKRTENTLRATKLENRDLPLLGFPVPTND